MFSFRPHPHKLVGKDCCYRGVCTTKIDKDTMTATFTNLGVHCVKRRDIRESLRLRNSIKVDAFQSNNFKIFFYLNFISFICFIAGFDHRKNPNSIDLTVFRLGFQVILKNPSTGIYNIPLRSVVSDPIMDKKPDGLNIVALSDCTSDAVGGKRIILLCEKVDKNDIQIYFSETVNGQTIWESYGCFLPKDVHKQAAISFTTPQYKVKEIVVPVKVQVQLRKPSTNAVGNPIPFEFTPNYDLSKKFLDDRMNSFESELLKKENFLFNVKEDPESGSSNYKQLNKVSNVNNLNVKSTNLLDMDSIKLENWNSAEIESIANQVIELPLISFDEEMITNSFKNMIMSCEEEKLNNLN